MSRALRTILTAVAAALTLAVCAPSAALGADYLGSFGRLGEQPGQFYRIEDIAIDGRGYVYVADSSLDSDGRVQKFTPDGKLVRQWGRNPDEDDRGDNDQVPGLLYYPTALAIGPDGNVYVAEDGPDRTRISVWTATGRYLRSFGSSGSGAGQFEDAGGLAFDTQGRLVVADGDNQRLTLFTQGGTSAGTLAGGNDIVAVDDPYLGDVADVTLGPGGSFYTTDGPQVKVFAADGTFRGLFGERADDPGPFFQDPRSLVFGGSTLYVSDRNLSRVQAFGAGGQFAGPVGLTSGSQPGQFTEPKALATDCHGTLYVADYGNARVQRFGSKASGACGAGVADDPAERFTVSVGGTALQRFREEFAVRPAVTCGRPCTALVSGTIRIAGQRRAVRLETEQRSVQFPGPLTVNLAPSERGTDQVLAALRRHRRVTATIKLSGRDLLGRVARASRSYRLR